MTKYTYSRISSLGKISTWRLEPRYSVMKCSGRASSSVNTLVKLGGGRPLSIKNASILAAEMTGSKSWSAAESTASQMACVVWTASKQFYLNNKRRRKKKKQNFDQMNQYIDLKKKEFQAYPVIWRSFRVRIRSALGCWWFWWWFSAFCQHVGRLVDLQLARHFHKTTVGFQYKGLVLIAVGMLRRYFVFYGAKGKYYRLHLPLWSPLRVPSDLKMDDPAHILACPLTFYNLSCLQNR